jgi:hypothetical protein
MTDYNWFSSGAIEVATEGLREEAKTWHHLSDRMSDVASNAARQSLAPSAFVVTDLITGAASAADLKAGYDRMNDWLNSLFKQAAVEFDRMGAALRKNADWYERADAESAQDFDAIAAS